MENTSQRQSIPLHGMFTAVPPHYDLVNRIVTLGMDRCWRQKAALTCLVSKPQRVLDLGCGTGDLTIKLAQMAKNGVEITGLDYSLPMLERARQKATLAGVANRLKFLHGEATQLPFPDGHLDCVGISFAFRNLTYKNSLCRPHLAEVIRVLRPGGRYVIVESSQPLNPVIRWFFHLYLRAFVRPVGIILSGNRAAYRYLAESAARFYSPGDVREMLLGAGFNEVSYRPLFFGAAGIHVAVK
jgi:demethylmenaquinone methyltransferase/2-methoxy-6-polyprenyl-1,4-benzoquinol methylase